MFEMPNSLSKKTLKTMRENYIENENKQLIKYSVGDQIEIDGEIHTIDFVGNKHEHDLNTTVKKALRTPNKLENITLLFGFDIGQELNINGDIKIVERIVKKEDNLADIYFHDPYKPKNRKEKRDLKFKRKII